MSQENFFTHRRLVWFWVCAVSLAAMIVLYALDDPAGGARGGTLLGEVYGWIAAAGIFYLMWYALRKRSYHSYQTTLKGVLSAHVWIGLTLLIVVPLHCGFSFGWNLHTLAYALMVVTIVSGFVGAIAYVVLAPGIMSHRGAGRARELFEQVELFSKEIAAKAHGKSDELQDLAKRMDLNMRVTVANAFFNPAPAELDRDKATKLLEAVPEKERDAAYAVVGLCQKKRDFLRRLHAEGRTMYMLKAWLSLHVPISCALLAALIIHIYLSYYY